MGCATSKKQPVCRNCRAPYSPMTRSHSMHSHHPPHTDGDNYHVVALKSSTLGYLQLDPNSNSNDVVQILPQTVRQNAGEKKSKEFAIGVIDAKTWSKMIDEKIPKFVPKTPVTTPPGEPETINAWELMEGLDDTSPLRPKAAGNHIRSFSFHVSPTPFPVTEESTNSIFSSNDTSITSRSDRLEEIEEIAEFRKSFELLPPANPFSLNPSKDGGIDDDSLIVAVTDPKKSLPNNSPPRVKEKLVLYFTSLRGVRSTYEDCCHVRHLLKATGVRVDERDVSMHSGFKDELKELSGGFIGGLPRVFIGTRCVGGAVEIRRLHEDGLLEKTLEGCEMGRGDSFGSGGCGGGGCEACGDVRFIPCETCSGSCKIYYEDECDETDDEGDDGKGESDYGFQRCPDCNENGLVRCPICCD